LAVFVIQAGTRFQDGVEAGISRHAEQGENGDGNQNFKQGEALV
jgi:hypothetical protein